MGLTLLIVTTLLLITVLLTMPTDMIIIKKSE